MVEEIFQLLIKHLQGKYMFMKYDMLPTKNSFDAI